MIYIILMLKWYSLYFLLFCGMKIKSLTLFTNKLSKQQDFYTKTLGFELLDEAQDSFVIQVGFTKLKFKLRTKHYKYHYCFLIPSNKLSESISWLQERLELIKIEEERVIQHFENWNADSVYFYDGAGNLAEFIVRYDLKNENQEAFSLSHILSVNEIGMPTHNVAKMNAQLEDKLNSKFWKGDLERFGTNGTQNGLFLLVNNEVKETWFPTELETQSSPFEATVDVAGTVFDIKFYNQEISVGNGNN